MRKCENCFIDVYDRGRKIDTVPLHKQQLYAALQIERNAEDEEFVRSRIPAEDLLGFIHYNTEVMDADRQGKSPYDFSNTVKEEITQIKNIIDQGL